MSSLSSSWPPQEMDAARAAINLLKSEKYKNSMYLFLTPFDIDQVPGYLDVVSKKLDLQTVEANLDSGFMYSNPNEFWDDLCGIFENAVQYHSTQQATSWIAKLAKDMLKVAHRERHKRDRMSSASLSSSVASSSTTNKKVKIRVGSINKGGGKNKGAMSVRDDSMPPPANPSSDGTAIAAASSEPSPSKKKVKLKLKLSSANASSSSPMSTSSSSVPPSATSQQQQPKLKLKLSLGGGSGGGNSGMAPSNLRVGEASTAAGGVTAMDVDDDTDVVVPAKPAKTGKQVPSGVDAAGGGATDASVASTKPKAKKPKLTLKLGGGGGASSGNSNAASSAGGNVVVPASGGQGPSRGKELPKGVVVLGKKKSPKAGASTNNAATASEPSSLSAAAAASVASGAEAAASSAPSSVLSTGGAPAATATVGKAHKKPKKPKNTNFPTAPATKVIMGLKRRQNKSIAWFLQPVSDKAILADYRAKIRHPIDLQTISSKLDRGVYASVAAFATDVRRITANCLQYNTSIKDSLRPVAVEVLETAEQLMGFFLKNVAASTAGAAPGNAASMSYPPLLYCWKLCIGVLDTLFNLVNPEDGQPTAFYFLHPVSYYCGGNFPPDYLEKVPKPMDFGTVTANLLEGKYQSCDEFCNDCRLVVSNCTEYYRGREDGKMYIEQASRLNEVLSQQVEQLSRYVRSSRGLADQARANAPVVLLQPPVSVLLGTLEELRALKYTDKATKITEPAMGPFERPVSLAAFPDYLQYVDTPMDLQTIERKVKSLVYATPEDFEYDMNLVFRNCELYNARRNGDHLVAMAKFGARQFRRMFYANIRAFEDPSSVLASPSAPESSASQSGGGPSKKIKLDLSSASAVAAAAASIKAKTAPRISITAAQVSSAALNAARAKSPGGGMGQKKSQQLLSASALSLPKADQPVPLHIAIARVKEAFPIRRPHKQLQPWEADCARYFKELMRHPWISAARPKFIFHVPVPILFPDLKETYSAKIRKPMDLTTVECTLLQGNRYTQPDDFLQDVALVFANAVRFNREGRDVGDPLSCAYYDASVHLLRYSRWLSLEILLPYSDANSMHVDEDTPDGLPPFSWRLTEGNRQRARVEMEKLVMSEPIDKSLEGDRYSWHEAECEKLLKALRHQSDLKYMTFFIQANYPADYTAFIAKPMDWEKVQRTLKKRQYDKFGDVVEDLRLIFSNALKYNSRLRGTDTVSGRAYDAATYMSAKLESAVAKFLLNVSDRLERERIDHTNAEREIESLEQAEEARIREAWKNPKEGEKESLAASSSAAGPGAASQPQSVATMSAGGGVSGVGTGMGLSASAGGVALPFPKVRLRAQRRETATDFEIPFFEDEDDAVTGSRHERSYFEHVKFQKSMFERQRLELFKMRQCAAALGSTVMARHVRHRSAVKWLQQQQQQSAAISGTAKAGFDPSQGDDKMAGHAKANESSSSSSASDAVLGLLEKPGREPVKLTLSSRLAPPPLPLKKNGRGTKRTIKAPPPPSNESLLSAFAGEHDDDDET